MAIDRIGQGGCFRGEPGMTRLFFLCSVTMMRLRQSRGVIKNLKKFQKESLFSKIQHIVKEIIH